MSQDKSPDRLVLTQYSFVGIILAVQEAVKNGYTIHEDTNEFYPKQYGACYIVHMDKAEDLHTENAEKFFSQDTPQEVVSVDVQEAAKEPAKEQSEVVTEPAKATESAKVKVSRKK